LLLGLYIGSMTLVALQAIVEKARWQLAPAYLVLVLVAIPVFSRWKRRHDETPPGKQRRWPRIVAIVFGVLALCSSALMATQLPVFSLAPPTGSHAIGVTSYEWVDADRTDEHPKTPSGHRRLVVKILYPAAPSNAPYEPYLDAPHADGFARSLKMPGFVLSHLSLVPTHAHRDIPLPSGNERFPVILFSHGYPLNADSGTFAMEELASHGYVVVSINHTYDTAFVSFRDGTSASVEVSGDVGKIDAVEKILGPRLAVWVADARFVLNEVTKLDATDSRFKGRLDLEHVGYFGHSFGGATAFATLAADRRFTAAINMDGAFFGISAQARPTQPFMLLNGDPPVVTDAQLASTGATRKEVDTFLEGVEAGWAASIAPAKGPRYRAKFAGVSHLGFSDLALMIPAAGSSKMPAPKAFRLINQYTLGFFDQYLKGQARPLLVGPAPDAAVTFTAVAVAAEP
jgi:predicted dienelactone hydrolase